MVNVHFFLLRAFFPKPGWSVLQDDRSLNIQKERAEIKMQNERKYPQNERKYPQTSANLKSVTIPPSSGWKKGMWSSVFSGGERFLGGRAEIGNSSVFFSYLKKRARWVPQEGSWRIQAGSSNGSFQGSYIARRPGLAAGLV